MTLSTAPEIRRDARKARRHARHRASLLDAAREVLAEEGLPGFTVARVAGRADVSKPSFYYYFRSREELVAALVVDGAGEDAAASVDKVAMAVADGDDMLVDRDLRGLSVGINIMVLLCNYKTG